MSDGGKTLVVGLDSSTTWARAVAWTATGEAVAAGRSPIPLAHPTLDRYEQDPEDWWRAAACAIRRVTDSVEPERIAGLSIAHQRETFVPLDCQGAPVRPAMVWLDRRAKDSVEPLVHRLGAERLLLISGKPPDVTPSLYRWEWMRRHEPEAFAATAVFADVHAWLTARLTGSLGTSWASADPSGAFDIADQRWSAEILAALELDETRMPPAHRPGTVLGEVTRDAAEATGLKSGTPVIAGGGDAQCAALGIGLAGTAGRDAACLILGSAVVTAVHFNRLRSDPAWHTLGAASGDGFVHESCLRTGGTVLDWFVGLVGGDRAAADGLRADLEAAAAEVPPGARGLILLPWFAGAMTPNWDADARGVFFGLTADHGRGEMYRALLEGIALDVAMGLALIEAKTGAVVPACVAVGGGAASTLWCRIIASAAGRPVRRSATTEPAALGAGMCAAVGCGLHPDMASAARAMAGPIVDTIDPDRRWAERYSELARIQRDLYPAVEDLYGRLARFAEQND